MSGHVAHTPTSADYAIVVAMLVGLVPSVVGLASRAAPRLLPIHARVRRVQRSILVAQATIVPCAIAVIWMWRGRPPEPLGLGVPTSVPALVALGLGVVWCVGMAVHCWSDARHCSTCEDCRRTWHEDTLQTYGVGSSQVRRIPVYVSVLQAIVEEVVFRGFLIWVLTSSLGLVGAVITAAVCFGVLHSGSLRWAIFATCVGLVLGTAYALTGSLWGIMIAHAGHNLSVMLHHRALVAMQPPEPTSMAQAITSPGELAQPRHEG